MLNYQAPYPRLRGEGLVGRDGRPYYPDPDLVAAANAALAIEAPLLLTGEAGCGKTDFAFAVASGLLTPEPDGRAAQPLECYVRSDTRARDLLYHYDAIRRFGDAQHGGPEGKKRAEDARPYVKLEALGEALMSQEPQVVLIDEIDKAPRDLPNDLLRELDQGHFEIPEIAAAEGAPPGPIDPYDSATYRHDMRRQDGLPKPLVVITSNVERQLPDPFLRRCVFFHITFPGKEQLREILQSRFNGKGLVLDHVIEIFQAMRDVPSLTKRPATSELIHWTQVLTTVYVTSDVKAVLARFAEKVGESGRSGLDWAGLPATGCLIKLREDRERLLGEL